LRIATDLGYLNIAECLLTAGADINAADKAGLTPLHVACSGWHVAMVRLLLSRGAKVDAADSHGRTPLHVICDRWFPEIAELLCDNGASVDAVDSNGNTPLLSACEGGKSAIARWLIDHQANINTRNKDGRTPLLVAFSSNSTIIIDHSLTSTSAVTAKAPDSSLPTYPSVEGGHMQAHLDIFNDTFSAEEMRRFETVGRSQNSRSRRFFSQYILDIIHSYAHSNTHLLMFSNNTFEPLYIVIL